MFSQISSRMICKYLNETYAIHMADTLEFWGYAPADVVEYVKTKFSTDVTADEIIKAARNKR